MPASASPTSVSGSLLSNSSKQEQEEIIWDSCGGEVLDFDDGHVPEHVSAAGRVVYHPSTYHSTAQVHVYDDVGPTELIDALYEYSVSPNRKGLPWGTYVKLPLSNVDDNNADQSIDALAARAVAIFLEKAKAESISNESYCDPNNNSQAQTPPWAAALDRLHGVAVWGLAANTGSSVPYHIDYAEQVRYTTNTTVVPIIAGTLQCTLPEISLGSDTSGAYQVVVRDSALTDHYARHGYKGLRQTPSVDNNDDNNWKTIPHRYNRLICQSGHLPHQSTRIDRIGVGTTNASSSDTAAATGNVRPGVPARRVIVGFNAFLADVGPCVQRAPEHSDVFRRQVKLLRHGAHASKSSGAGGNMTVAAVRKNPAVAKLLVAAKRQRVREQLAQVQAAMDDRIIGSTATPLRIVAQELAEPDEFPREADVLVHLERRWREGWFQLNTPHFSPDSIIERVSATARMK